MARLAIGYRRRPGQGAHKCRGAGRPPKYSRSGPDRKDNGTTSQPLPGQHDHVIYVSDLRVPRTTSRCGLFVTYGAYVATV
jgi:hypothetical protein